MKRIVFFICLMFIGTTYADTRNIKWYANNSVYDTTTCTVGDDVNLPANAPTKRGYTFTGWEIPFYDFSTLNTTDNGTDHKYNPSAKTWVTTFDWGQISGISLCSIDSGTYGVAGTPDETTPNGQYCWCRATSYKPTGSNITYEPIDFPLPWVFRYNGTDCASGCVLYCGLNVKNNAAFRRAVFGVTQ